MPEPSVSRFDTSSQHTRSEDGQMTEIAPGVAVSGRVRRVVYEGHPREHDYETAQQAVRDVRSDLSRIRHRLEMMQRIETDYAHDSQALRAAGAIHCAIVALYRLEEGEGSFTAKAERVRELWTDVAACPDNYVVEQGTRGSRPGSEWKWRDWAWEPGKPTLGAPDA